MPNPNYNKQVAQGYSAKSGKKYSPRARGGMGAEHGGAQKDTITRWPGAGGPGRGKLPGGFPVVKTVVVCEGANCGGNSRYKK